MTTGRESAAVYGRGGGSLRRAVWLAGLLGAGIGFSRVVAVDASVLLACATGLAIVGVVGRGLVCRAALGLAVFGLGAGWCGFRVDESRADALGPALSWRAPTLLEARGVVLGAPAYVESGGAFAELVDRPGRMRFDLSLESVRGEAGWRSASGRLAVWVDGDELFGVRAGDRVQALGLARGVSPGTNPGEGDWRALAAQSGFAGHLGCASAELVSGIDYDSRWGAVRGWGIRVLGETRGRVRGVIEAGAGADRDSEDSTALLSAMLLGEREAGYDEVQSAFQRVGTAHVLAVSGLHLAFLTLLALVAVRAVSRRGWAEPFIVALIVLVYVLLAPARAPVIRAAIMVWIFLGADATGRRFDSLNTLAWAAIFVLIWRPLDLFSPGFQLSFSVVGALIALTPRVTQRWFGERPAPDEMRFASRVLWRIREAVVVSVVAWLVATPLVMHHFGMFNPLGAAATLIVMPLAVMVLAPGFLLLAVAAIAPGLAGAASSVLHALAGALRFVVAGIETIPIAVVYTPAVGWPLTIAMLMIIVWWLMAGSWRKLRGVMATAIVVVWMAASFLSPSLPRDQALRVDAFDVGDGTCMLVRTREACFLWDCGSMDLDIGVREIPDALRALGVRRLDAIVITHANIDHYSAVLDIVERFGAPAVLLGPSFNMANGDFGDPAAYLLHELERAGIQTRILFAGESIEPLNIDGEILWPPKDFEWRRANNSSLVMELRVSTGGGERSILLTGDIEAAAIEGLLVRRVDLSPDVMEAPHHGSARPGAMSFISDVGPAVVIQSTGPSRAGDERWAEVREGTRWLSTAEVGAVSVWIDVEGEVHSLNQLPAADTGRAMGAHR